MRLAFEDWCAEVAPQLGGSVLSLTRAALPVLRPTSDEAFASGSARRTACYPLLPYANRIAHGRFRWRGVEHALQENFPDSTHPLHGVGWRRAWQIVTADSHSCELRLEHRPRNGNERDWPFAFDAEQKISLHTSGLTISLSIVNTSASSAPLGLGLHPVFPRRGSDLLYFAAAGAWRNGADMLPAAQVSGGLWDHSGGRPVGAQALDNDFFGWGGTARIEAQSAPAIRITASGIFSVLRVFTPPGQEFFAVEPVSHITDGINRSSESTAVMLSAQPGECLAGTVCIDAESPL